MPNTNTVTISGQIWDQAGYTQLGPQNMINSQIPLPGTRVTLIPAVSTQVTSTPVTAVGVLVMLNVSGPNTVSINGILVPLLAWAVIPLAAAQTTVSVTCTAANGGTIELVFF